MRSNLQIFWDNEWDKYDFIQYTTQHPNWPVTNTQNRWPAKSWRSNHGTNSGWGSFYISASIGTLYFDEGGGQISVTIPIGYYNADTLADEIENQMNGSGVSGACIYYCYYDDSTNKFVIATDPSCNVNLLCTVTTNAIWDTIGFDTSADTGNGSLHIADYIRIHRYEQIIIDAGAGNVIDWCGIGIKNDNIQSTGLFRFQLSDDFFATIPFSIGLTKNTLGKNQRFNLFSSTQSYRYARIIINDRDNPDGYVEVGRIFGGCSFRPRIGFSPKYTVDINDPSIISESEDGQAYVIEKAKYDERDYDFGLVTSESDDLINGFSEILRDRGTSKELWTVEMPTSSTLNSFTNPENNSYYCRFKSQSGFKHIAGTSYSLKLKIQEER